MKTNVLRAVCLGLCAAGLLFGAAPAQAAKKFTVGHIQAVDQVIHQSLLQFKEHVEKESNGAIVVEIFPNSQLGNALNQITSVRMGTLTAFVDGVGWFGQLLGDYYLPATAYAIKNWDAYRDVMEGPIGQEMAEKLRTQYGIRAVDHNWSRLPRHLLSVKPVKSIADLQGMKLRVPELKSYILPWRAMGATPTPIAFAEVYLALHQGIADGLECPIDAMYLQSLHEPAKFLTLTTHQMESAGFFMSEEAYQSYTPEERKIIEAGVQLAKEFNDKFNAEAEGQFRQKMEKDGVTFITVDVNEFYERAKGAPAQLEAEGTWTKGLAAKVAEINAKH